MTDTPVPRRRVPEVEEPRAAPVKSSAAPLPAVTLSLSALDMERTPEEANLEEPVRMSTEPP